MRYRFVHILAALFLIAGMTVQFVVSYRQTRLHVQERIDLKMQIAQEKLLFEIYDSYEALDQLAASVEENISSPDKLLKETRNILRRYPSLFTCYVAFPEYCYPEKGKWYSPCSYRVGDSLYTIRYGDRQHDYFEREWYQGALRSSDTGYWSQPYSDEDFQETIFTYSDDLRDADGNLICVTALDFSLSWMKRLLEQFKPFEEAVLVLYSSSGTTLTSSGNGSYEGDSGWIASRQKMAPFGIEMVMAVPQSYVLKCIRAGLLLPMVVFILGILVVSLLIRRMLRDQQENDLLETQKKLMENELQIAHDIQMGILRQDFPQDDDIRVYARLLPMREVGGDLYDFYRDEDFLWLILGDVSGKGVPAAMFMSATVNLFRTSVRRYPSPKEVMEEMNAVLSWNNPSLTFVTAFVGRLHIPSGELIYCNAGHCAPVLSTGECLPVIPNIPLGYDGKFRFEEQVFQMEKGRTLVLYSDGVTESRDTERKMMGLKRWTAIVAGGGDLLAAVKDYMGDAEPTDDITIMEIKL